jgi:ABC-2 type transport system permease protein
MIMRTANLVAKEFIQLFRDRLLILFILLVPVLQLMLLAQNTSRGVQGLSLAVLDLDRSAYSRRLAEKLDNTDVLDLRYHPADEGELQQLVDRGRVWAAAVIPPGFARDLLSPNQTPTFHVLADASNTVAASNALQAAQRALAEFLNDLSESLGQSTDTQTAGVEVRIDVRFNPALNARSYTIPAQVGFIIYQVTLTVAALGLARERELGTLEQLVVTPLGRLELVLGKAMPALAVGFANALVMLALSIWVFDVPMNGSPLVLLGLTALFISAEIGWGLVISTVSRTQQQAILFVFVLAMVDIAFSGYLVPVDNLPAVLSGLGNLFPLRHYLAILRSVMFRGASLAELWQHTLAMGGLGAIVALIAMRSVANRLD